MEPGSGSSAVSLLVTNILPTTETRQWGRLFLRSTAVHFITWPGSGKDKISQLCVQDTGLTALHGRVRAMWKGGMQQHGHHRAGQVEDFTLDDNHEACYQDYLIIKIWEPICDFFPPFLKWNALKTIEHAVEKFVSAASNSLLSSLLPQSRQNLRKELKKWV